MPFRARLFALPAAGPGPALLGAGQRGSPARPSPRRREPRNLGFLLALAVCLPLLVLAASGLISWQATWRQARQDAQRAAEAAGEYSARILDSHRLLLQRLDDLLRPYTNAEIHEREAQLHQAIRRLQEGLPAGTLTSFALDETGHALVSAALYPVPRDMDFSDRSYFAALSRPVPPVIHISSVIRSRVEDQLYFAVSRRRSAPPGAAAGEFHGLLSLSVYPREVAAGMTQMAGDGAETTALVRSDGAVLASTAGFGAPPPPLAQPALRRAMAEALPRLVLRLPADAAGPARLVALRQVPGWPLYALASRAETEIAGAWRAQMLPQLAVGLPASGLLAVLAWLVRRQQGALRRANRSLEERVAERTAALAASEAEFRATFDSAITGKAKVDLAGFRIARVNERFCRITGYDPVVLEGRMSLAEMGLVAPGPEEAACRAALAQGGRFEQEKRIQRQDGREAWVLLACAPIQDGSATPPRLIVALEDITARKLAEERQALLAREVDHRAKNALAVVQAAVRLTPKRDPESYARAIEGRVGALARAQTLLAGAQWAGAELRALLNGELSAFLVPGLGGPAVRLDGPAVSVPPEMAQPLSMAVHELATNAIKHGALSTRAGQLEILWRLEAGTLRLEWREAGGPPLQGVPARRGFGSRLLRATVVQQLGGRLALEWPDRGLRAVLELPLRPGSQRAA